MLIYYRCNPTTFFFFLIPFSSLYLYPPFPSIRGQLFLKRATRVRGFMARTLYSMHKTERADETQSLAPRDHPNTKKLSLLMKNNNLLASCRGSQARIAYFPSYSDTQCTHTRTYLYLQILTIHPLDVRTCSITAVAVQRGWQYFRTYAINYNVISQHTVTIGIYVDACRR